ncbi:MAG: PQQ-binding-like beta-propeller repeat protein [Steroidobacteraceae bacterium]
MTARSAAIFWPARTLLSCLLAILIGCGGGESSEGSAGGSGTGSGSGSGGSGSGSGTVTPEQPLIMGSILSFQPGSVPAELALSPNDSLVTVRVWNQARTASIATATVTINGTTLPYDAAAKDYFAPLLISPGGNVNLVVTVDGVRYTVSNKQFDTYPSITVPVENATWSGSSLNSIRWNSVPPRSTAVHLLTMLGAHSSWPSDGSWRALPGYQNSYDIPAGQLSDDNYVLLAGIGEIFDITGAHADSYLAMAGFGSRHVTVSTPSAVVTVAELKFSYWLPNPLTIPVTATRTVTLETTWSDGGRSSVDSLATWLSSNPAIVAIQGPGVIKGIAAGTAVVSASYGGKTATLTVNVFAPTPSPTGPLSSSVAMQVDAAHSGSATLGGGGPTLPLTGKWTATLNGTVSYPVVADGKVFVTTSTPLVSRLGGHGTSLHALNVSTGAVAWGPVDIPGTGHWSGHAYDNGKLFVLNSIGELRSFNAATGAAGWTVQLTGQSSFSSTPVAVNGLVYVAGAGGGSTVYAVNQSDGAVVWSEYGSMGSRTASLSHNGLFMASACRVSKFNPLTGETLWRYALECSTSTNMTPVYADDRLFVRRDQPQGTGLFNTDLTSFVFDANTGAKLTALATTVLPAVANGLAYYLVGTTLSAVNLTTGATLWSFSGDQNLVSAPLVIDNVVIVGSKLGAVYALNSSNGNVLWTGQVASDMGTADRYGGTVAPSAGLGLGNGYLLVPAGNTLTGWKMVP